MPAAGLGWCWSFSFGCQCRRKKGCGLRELKWKRNLGLSLCLVARLLLRTCPLPPALDPEPFLPSTSYYFAFSTRCSLALASPLSFLLFDCSLDSRSSRLDCFPPQSPLGPPPLPPLLPLAFRPELSQLPQPLFTTSSRTTNPKGMPTNRRRLAVGNCVRFSSFSWCRLRLSEGRGGEVSMGRGPSGHPGATLLLPFPLFRHTS